MSIFILTIVLSMSIITLLWDQSLQLFFIYVYTRNVCVDTRVCAQCVCKYTYMPV